MPLVTSQREQIGMAMTLTHAHTPTYTCVCLCMSLPCQLAPLVMSPGAPIPQFRKKLTYAIISQSPCVCAPLILCRMQQQQETKAVLKRAAANTRLNILLSGDLINPTRLRPAEHRMKSGKKKPKNPGSTLKLTYLSQTDDGALSLLQEAVDLSLGPLPPLLLHGVEVGPLGRQLPALVRAVLHHRLLLLQQGVLKGNSGDA